MLEQFINIIDYPTLIEMQFRSNCIFIDLKSINKLKANGKKD